MALGQGNMTFCHGSVTEPWLRPASGTPTGGQGLAAAHSVGFAHSAAAGRAFQRNGSTATKKHIIGLASGLCQSGEYSRCAFTFNVFRFQITPKSHHFLSKNLCYLIIFVKKPMFVDPIDAKMTQT